MERTATLRNVIPIRRPSLVDSIARLRSDFSSMKNELREAHTEIARLKGILATWRSRCRKLPQVDLAALRRHLAYYCHPDRGGDVELMSRINTVFDFLNLLECPEEPRLEDCKEGALS